MTARTALAHPEFWVAAFERAAKTAAQSFVAVLIADEVTGLVGVDWGDTFSVVGLAALLSLLTSIGSDAVTTTPGPSLTTAEALTEEDDTP